MGWKKLGLIYNLSPAKNRSTNHMQGPVALLTDNCIRIYYSARHGDGKSYPAYMDVDVDDPLRVLSMNEDSVMEPGPIGTFDEDGVMPACVLPVNDKVWMYYSGWNKGVSVPYHNTTGIGYSLDGGRSFKRMFNGPVLDRVPREPFMAVTPWVLKDGNCWHMWYVSGLSWESVNEKLEPVYAIKYAYSDNGIDWERDGQLVIPQRHPLEAIARPTVLVKEERYHMWFCYRDSLDFRDGVGSYRIGYANSEDGRVWDRKDHLAGIDVSKMGWDSLMLCYPYVLPVGNRVYMFYNGNSFGQTGIGCAEWDGCFP